VHRLFTWQAKARQTREIYRWALGRRPDPPSWGRPFTTVQDDAATAGEDGRQAAAAPARVLFPD
jgi:hypothetical protein